MNDRSVVKYSLYIRVMHWTVGFLMLAVLVLGLYMTDLPWDLPLKGDLYSLHKSFGMIVIPLAVLRLIFRFSSDIPALPKQIKKIDAILAKIGVFILYLFMFIIPLSGYLMSITSGYAVEVFGVKIPNVFEKDENIASFFYTIHVQIWYFFLLVVGIHALYSVKHLVYEKVNLFRRMW